jgi:hypothetical protein
MEENYLDFGGTTYYVDLEAFDKLLSIDGNLSPKTVLDTVETKTFDEKGKLTGSEISTTTTTKNKEINIATYETLRMFLEIVLTYHDESDDTLGADRALLGTPLSFKIAFNTLLKHGIIKELL